jgi:hypothetical protein
MFSSGFQDRNSVIANVHNVARWGMTSALSLLSGGFNTVVRAVHFARTHPLQAIVAALAAQSAVARAMRTRVISTTPSPSTILDFMPGVERPVAETWIDDSVSKLSLKIDTAEFQVNTYTMSYQEFSSVATLSTGGFVVTWHSNGQDGDGFGIYAQRYDANGSRVGSEFQVNTYTTSDQLLPSVAALSTGGFVVTWNSNGQDGSANGVYAQSYQGRQGRSVETPRGWPRPRERRPRRSCPAY